MPPHAPTRDVTTTETIEDKDTTINKVIRDHDELGQHVHSEVIDKVCPAGHTHTEIADVEKDDGEVAHKEVMDRDGIHGEHIHQVVTNTDKGDRHVQQTVTDTDVDGKHIHEEEKTVTNATQRGDGIVKRVVADRDEPGFAHHEEVTTITKDSGAVSTAEHSVDDVNVDGLHMHEVRNRVEAGGNSKESHIMVTDKDLQSGHVHTEQVERLSEIKGEKRAVVDSKLVVDREGGATVDVIHQEVTNSGGVTTHHIETDKNVGGADVHEVKDVVASEAGVQKQRVVVTDKNIPEGHVHTETVQKSETGNVGSKVVVDEKVVVNQGEHVTVDQSHKEAAIKVDEQLGVCAAQHVENEREVGGAKIREVADTVQVAGGVQQVRTIVSDKDTSGGHIHTEKVEQVVCKDGVQTTVVDEAVMFEKKGDVTLDVTHTETREQEGAPAETCTVHHVETAKVGAGGEVVREITDTVQADGETKTTEVVVTEQEAEGTHVYTEVVKVTDANNEGTTTKIDEVVMCDDTVVQHVECVVKEQVAEE